jgi:opacity protein-like surface antigen
MRSPTFSILLTLGAIASALPATAQQSAPGPRAVSLLAGTFQGAFDSTENTPMIGTRYRVGVTRLSAAELELGIGRSEDSGCLIAISDGSFDACSGDRTTLFTAGLTHGLYVPVGPLRPYALAGVGTVLASEYGIAGFAVIGGGLTLRVIQRLSARAEIGRRFNGNGGATQFMAGFEFDVTGR